MTDIENNLIWLAKAMTVPQQVRERYYYDAKTNLFFYAKPIVPYALALYTTLDFPVPKAVYDDIAERFESIYNENTDIVEIPRLNVQEKVALQMQFLSNFKKAGIAEELLLAVEEQRDAEGMILDKLLAENKSTAPITTYWNEFKFNTVATRIKNLKAHSLLK